MQLTSRKLYLGATRTETKKKEKIKLTLTVGNARIKKTALSEFGLRRKVCYL